MELFGSADEETWDFIKRQIENCDYYVVIVAGKYGSTAEDGVSYTEKEYNYAKEINKPVLAFVHGDRNTIRRDKTEDDVEKRSSLEAFIQKVRRSPVSFFTTPHDLATQVTVSFVNLRDRQPAVGFIRANQVPDLKKYTDLLEENVFLRAEVTRLKNLQVADIPFPNASETMTLTLVKRTAGEREEHEISIACKDLFVSIAECILTYPAAWFGEGVRRAIAQKYDAEVENEQEVFNRILLRFVGWGLLERLPTGGCRLTEYGQKQYGLLMH